MRSPLCSLLAIATAMTLQAPAAAAGATASPLQIVSGSGVDGLRLGASVRSLHRRHLIGRLRPGCELAPGQRVAPLRPPLRGFAVFRHPRQGLSALTIRGGAETARGIGIGSTPREARQAYPRADYDRPGSLPPFAQGFVWVNDIEHPKMTFIVDPSSHRISEISVPAPNFCE